MKDKTLKQLFKLKPVSTIMSLLDKNGAASMVGAPAHLAKDIVESGYELQGDILRIYIPNPHKMLLVDKLKWFGMIPVLLEKDIEVEIHVASLPDVEELDSPYQQALSKVPTITIIEHSETPSDLEFDYTFFCHSDLTQSSIECIRQIKSRRVLFTFWGEMDYMVNSRFLQAYGIEVDEPKISDFTVISGVENGSGWCLITTSTKTIKSDFEADHTATTEAKFIKAMYNHSSQLGYTNPRTRPGNSIRDIRVNNVLHPQMIYVIDNLMLDGASGLLYEYKRNRDTFMIAEVHDIAHPPESKSFIENLLWAYTLKAIYHLKASENDHYNQAVYEATIEYAKLAPSESIRQLMIGNILEINGDKEKASDLYLANIELGSAEILYRAGSLNTQLKRHGSKSLFAEAAKLGSAIAAYNYAVIEIEHGLTQTTLPVCIEYLTKASKKGFEPAQSALAELLLQTGEPKESVKWLRKSSENGNVDSAYNLVIVLKDLHEAGLCEKFELKKAQKALKNVERNHRNSLNRSEQV